jgi:hypothetical protein
MFTILNINLEFGGENYGLWKIAKKIKSSKSDIVVLCEVYTRKRLRNVDRGKLLQKCFFPNWSYVSNQDNEIGILTKYSKLEIQHAHTYHLICSIPKLQLLVCAVHFNDYPYQAFQVVNQPYCENTTTCQPFLGTAKDAEKAAKVARFDHFRFTYNTVTTIAKKSEYKLQIIAGDFNEPSHLDWNTHNSNKDIVPFLYDFQFLLF